MIKNKVRISSLILGAFLAFTILSCEKEQVSLDEKAQTETTDDSEEVSNESILNLSGTWQWESTETADGTVTSAEVDYSKKLYFKEDQAYFYTNDAIVKSGTYTLYANKEQTGVDAIVLIFEGDNATYEASISPEEILTIMTQDCNNREIVKYSKS